MKQEQTIPTKIEPVITNNYINYYKNIYIDSKDNLYFGNKNGAYVLKQGEKILTKINEIPNDVITNIAIDSENNVYFRTFIHVYKVKNNNNLLAIKINGILDGTPRGTKFSIVFDKNNNVYFTSSLNFYLLRSGETTATKIAGTDEIFKWGGDWIYSIDSENNVYFTRDYFESTYKIKNGETTATEIIKIPKLQHHSLYSSTIKGNNSVYFCTDNGAFVLKQGETTPTKINGIDNKERFYFVMAINDSKNNIYFIGNGLYVLKQGETTPKIIEGIDNKSYILKIVVDSEDNIYIGTISGAYVLKRGSTKSNKINEINGLIEDIIINKNDNVYFKNRFGSFWFLKNKLNFQDIIKNNNLGKTNNNSDETILNILNYLNRENNYFLNLNKMKVINKTPTSATILATKGKYHGEVNVTYKIKNQDEISDIDLNDLLKKAFYFDFIDKNFYSIAKIKEIKDIDTNNLSFGNVEVSRDSELLHSVNFKRDVF